MSETDVIKAGIAAFQSGDRAKAATLFAQVVKQNPLSEQGWYMLGMSVSSPEQREYCLKRVLVINPNNENAHRALMPQSAPPSQYHEPLSQPFIDAPQRVPAFVDEEKVRESITQPLVDEKPRQAESPKRKPVKKNNNRVLVISMIAAFFIGLCSLGGVFLLLRNRLPIASTPAPASQPIAAPATQALPTLLPTTVSTPAPPTVLPSPLPTVVYTPEFEETPCWFNSDGVDARCGYAIVPENRSGDPTDTIRLAVAVFKGRRPSQIPVMFLQGGPGADAVQLSANAYSVLVEPALEDRDFIVFDQRGTGLSEPVLKCDELTKSYQQDIYGTIPAETREIVYGNSFLSCNGLLRAQGVDPGSYTTVESAADVRDILQLLGYPKVHLYGASYGTRLAQVVMRDHPEIVESAILDSVVPVETNFFKNYPLAIQDGLRTLFTSCMTTPKCNMAYPNLETVFWETFNNLNENPVTLTTSIYPIGTITETVDGTVFLSTILSTIKGTYYINIAPQTIYRVRNGDFSTLTAAQYSLPFAFDGIAPGLYISMMCHEHVLSTNPQDLAAINAQPGISSYAWLPFYGDAENVFKSCQSWGAKAPQLGENDAVNSDIPTLVIEGAFDPTTPPSFGQLVATHLPNSYYFEFNNQGHVPTVSDNSQCAMDIALEFLRNPHVEPNRSCLSDLKPIEYLTPYTGSPALSMSSEDLGGITVDIPDGWMYTSDGFFARASSAFDVTQVGAFHTNFSSASELKDYFSMSAYGYRGLDAAPLEAGTHTASGRIWMLYTATSDDRPVDIAIADLGDTSLVIMMFSHTDEHEPLYQTVFLPMIDSAR